MIEVKRVRVWMGRSGNPDRWADQNASLTWLNDEEEFKCEKSIDLAFFTVAEMERLLAKAREDGHTHIAVSVVTGPVETNTEPASTL